MRGSALKKTPRFEASEDQKREIDARFERLLGMLLKTTGTSKEAASPVPFVSVKWCKTLPDDAPRDPAYLVSSCVIRTYPPTRDGYRSNSEMRRERGIHEILVSRIEDEMHLLKERRDTKLGEICSERALRIVILRREPPIRNGRAQGDAVTTKIML